jgi:hypothetical protein
MKNVTSDAVMLTAPNTRITCVMVPSAASSVPAAKTASIPGYPPEPQVARLPEWHVRFHLWNKTDQFGRRYRFLSSRP